MIGLLKRAEPLLLFLIIFFPGYILQNSESIDADLFNNPSLNIVYLMTTLPQTILVAYLILQDKSNDRLRFGLTIPLKRDFLKAFIALGQIFMALIPLYLLGSLLMTQGIISDYAAVEWKFTNYSIIPLVFITCLSTGYLEEIYFRSYLISKGEVAGVSKWPLLLGINFLFAAGHLYQGVMGFIVTFGIGMVLSLVFIKRRNIHIIALGHGYYNFLILLISGLFYAGGGN